MNNTMLNTIDIGSVIQYVLLPSQLPTNPNKIWRGRVEKVIRDISNSGGGVCWIHSVEPEYNDLEEYVFFNQIVSIEEEVAP